MFADNDKKIIIVKIGTEALLKKNGSADVFGSPDEAVMESVIRQLVTLKRQEHTVMLVSSGAVGTGRAVRKIAKRDDETLAEKQAHATVGQSYLMRLYARLLEPYQMFPSQALFVKRDFGRSGRKLELDPSNGMDMVLMQDDIIPIINENDLTSTHELRFSDNDDLAGSLALNYRADHLVFLTEVGGVYTSDPREKGAELIHQIDLSKAENVQVDVEGISNGGKGGMKSKMRAAYRLLQSCPKSKVHVIAPRGAGDFIIDAISGRSQMGTVIYGNPRRRLGGAGQKKQSLLTCASK